MPLSVRLRRAGGALAVFGVIGAILYAKGMPCVFAHLFHVPCPGCGSTRAVLALLSGDLHGMLVYNPLGPAAALLIGILAAQALASVVVHGDLRGAGQGRLGQVVKVCVLVVAVAEVVVWIARFFGALGGPVPV
jgi:hypothetical protein